MAVGDLHGVLRGGAVGGSSRGGAGAGRGPAAGGADGGAEPWGGAAARGRWSPGRGASLRLPDGVRLLQPNPAPARRPVSPEEEHTHGSN